MNRLAKQEHGTTVKSIVQVISNTAFLEITKQFSNSNAATKGDFNRLIKHKESFYKDTCSRRNSFNFTNNKEKTLSNEPASFMLDVLCFFVSLFFFVS